MRFFELATNEVIGFFGLRSWIEMATTGDYDALLTGRGFMGAVGPLLPFLLVFEIVRAFVHKGFRARDYKLIFFTYVLNRVLGSFIAIAALAFCIGLFEPYAIFKSSITWYWLLYGYVVWELGHFIYHYLAHKVRLLWCLHATHHSPESMNLFVSHAHFFLEAPYADTIRTSVCILLGVSPPLLFLIMFIDGTWGMFIHAGEHLIRDGRLGFLNRWILTPSHHRVHHSRNPLYMDTNFCNLLSIWDRLFGTWQDERVAVPPEYGITRPMRPGNFRDFYFGELVALWRDVRIAPGWSNKLAYVVMPPGWSHTGAHKTASLLRREYLAETRLAEATNVVRGPQPARGLST
jgi:sterol desaturase/sphingolipid hydroxylase (fatty acid hydroxylase superfamily)